MVKALDAVPYDERQWGNFLAQNVIKTEPWSWCFKNGKSR